MVYFLPVCVFILGVIMRMMHWPGANLVLVIGLFGTIVRSSIFFFIKKQSWASWIYFIARQLLTVAIGLQIALGPFGIPTSLLSGALGFFVIAAMMKLFERKKEKVETTNEPEDY